MIKHILILFLLAPVLSWAQNCRFSPDVQEHASVTNVGCAEKLCTSVVTCGSVTKLAVCKTKNGSCDNIDPDTCSLTAETLAKDASVQTSPWKKAPAPDQGGGGR